jgi:hypothetical protein
VYDGEYVDNMKQGQGTMTFPDKSKYEGVACFHLLHYIAAGSSSVARKPCNGSPCTATCC